MKSATIIIIVFLIVLSSVALANHEEMTITVTPVPAEASVGDSVMLNIYLNVPQEGDFPLYIVKLGVANTERITFNNDPNVPSLVSSIGEFNPLEQNALSGKNWVMEGDGEGHTYSLTTNPVLLGSIPVVASLPGEGDALSLVGNKLIRTPGRPGVPEVKYRVTALHQTPLTVLCAQNDQCGVGGQCNVESGICSVDTDGDGVSDEDEEAAGSDPHNRLSTPDDIDADGTPNNEDNDDDNDGVADDDDNCPAVPNPEQENNDGDSRGNACDDTPNEADVVDGDSDGIADDDDNCPAVPNPEQTDTDGNGIGDACDDEADTDGDTVPDHLEGTYVVGGGSCVDVRYTAVFVSAEHNGGVSDQFYSVGYSESVGNFNFLGCPRGDVNLDARITGADFSTWLDLFRLQQQTPDQQGISTGDINQDGKITGTDFSQWLDQFRAFS